MKIGYIRISTKEQNTARQEVIMEEYGIGRLFTDTATGKNADRQSLKEMMEFIREGDTVYVESISRFARSTRDLLRLIDQLEAKNVGFVSHKESIDTKTPQGRLTLTLFSALAEFEREQQLERIHEGIEIAKREGRFKGRPPKIHDNWKEVYTAWCGNEITATKASELLRVSRSTFYRMAGHMRGKDDIHAREDRADVNSDMIIDFGN